MEEMADPYAQKTLTLWVYGNPINNYYNAKEIERISKDLKEDWSDMVKMPDKLIQDVVDHAKMLFSMTKI